MEVALGCMIIVCRRLGHRSMAIEMDTSVRDQDKHC